MDDKNPMRQILTDNIRQSARIRELEAALRLIIDAAKSGSDTSVLQNFAADALHSKKARPMIAGHPEVTKKTYAQERDKVERAVRFAIGAVHNGLGADHQVPAETVAKLTAQIERDFLVEIME